MTTLRGDMPLVKTERHRRRLLPRYVVTFCLWSYFVLEELSARCIVAFWLCIGKAVCMCIEQCEVSVLPLETAL